jgi:hypothetical protein
MQSRNAGWRIAIYLALVLSVLAATPVWAYSGAVDVQKKEHGAHPHLPALWYQWISGQPAIDVDGTNTNPVLDSTGAYAAAGQERGIGPGNKYFFLAGSFFGDVTRTVTVPKDKILFFPIYNVQIDNAVPEPEGLSARQMCDIAVSLVNNVTEQYARLDGVPIETFRMLSKPFSYKMVDENSLYDYFGLFGPQFEGNIAPSCADGYWAVIERLAPGNHVLEFGSADSSGFAINIVYNLTVQ